MFADLGQGHRQHHQTSCPRTRDYTWKILYVAQNTGHIILLACSGHHHKPSRPSACWFAGLLFTTQSGGLLFCNVPLVLWPMQRFVQTCSVTTRCHHWRTWRDKLGDSLRHFRHHSIYISDTTVWPKAGWRIRWTGPTRRDCLANKVWLSNIQGVTGWLTRCDCPMYKAWLSGWPGRTHVVVAGWPRVWICKPMTNWHPTPPTHDTYPRAWHPPPNMAPTPYGIDKFVANMFPPADANHYCLIPEVFCRKVWWLITLTLSIWCVFQTRVLFPSYWRLRRDFLLKHLIIIAIIIHIIITMGTPMIYFLIWISMYITVLWFISNKLIEITMDIYRCNLQNSHMWWAIRWFLPVHCQPPVFSHITFCFNCHR